MPERQIIDRLRRAALSDANRLNDRTAVLIALAHRAGVLKNVLEKGVLKSRKKRLEEIAKGVEVAQAARDVVRDQEAAAAAVIVTSS